MIEFKKLDVFLNNSELLVNAIKNMGGVFIHWDSKEGGCRLAYRSAVYLQNAIRANLASGGISAGKQYQFAPLDENTNRLREYYGFPKDTPGILSGNMLNSILVIKTGPRSYKVGIPQDAKNKKTLMGPFYGAMKGKKRTGKRIQSVQAYAERFEFGARWTHPFTHNKVYQPARPFFYPAIRKFIKDNLDDLISHTILKDLDAQIIPLYVKKIIKERSIDLGGAVSYVEGLS